MHVLKRIEQLAEEVAPAVLPETGGTADVLTEVEQKKSSCNILEDNEHKAVNSAAGGWLEDLTVVAVIEELNDVAVLLQGLEGAHFSEDSLTRAHWVLLEEFILDYLNSNKLLGRVNGLR